MHSCYNTFILYIFSSCSTSCTHRVRLFYIFSVPAPLVASVVYVYSLFFQLLPTEIIATDHTLIWTTMNMMTITAHLVVVVTMVTNIAVRMLDQSLGSSLVWLHSLRSS